MKFLRLFTGLLIICFCQKSFSQDRVNKPLPTISKEVYGKLTEATGWRLDTRGQWDSGKNEISLEDNFISYELRKLYFEDTSYYILIKKFDDTYYEYPAIKQGLNHAKYIYYYIFDTLAISSLKDLKQNKLQLIKLPIKRVCFIPPVYFTDDIGDKSTLETVLEDIPAGWKTPDPVIGRQEEMLCINIQIKQEKNLVRFLIFKSGKSYERDEIKGVVNPHDFKLSPDNLKSFYYETTLTNFQNLFKDLTVIP